MERVPGYEIKERIDDSRAYPLYRAINENSGDRVILRPLQAGFFSYSVITRLKQEYQTINSFNLTGVIKTYDIINYKDGVALIHEDFNGYSLKKEISTGTFDSKAFLNIAIAIAGILGELHRRDIVHKNLHSNNVLVQRAEETVKITGFGISPVMLHESEIKEGLALVDESMLYMSPEQTGRIKKIVDYRTDLYSLGIIFYEMLMGHVPFNSTDPMEIIHSHLARKPLSPVRADPSIPGVISGIVMKLLSKATEERYQNAFGLMADLEECRVRLLAKEKITHFELAEKDNVVKFKIPGKLFGRNEEIRILLSGFERAAVGRCEIMLVSGNAGIGKTALVNEIHKPVAAKKGYFIYGRYEQLGVEPYSAIIRAFRRLTRQVLSESKEKIMRLKNDLLTALGPNGKVISDVIPGIEPIIGKQPEIGELDAEGSQNRFNHVFKNFVRVIARKEFPIALFLDNCQWADNASLQLLKILVTDPDIKYLFLIGAYRDSEIGESHPTVEVLREIEREHTPVSRMALGPLKVNHVNDSLSNFLGHPREIIFPLAELVHRKTGGNPFFINQFLTTLYEKKLLQFVSYQDGKGKGGWQWNIDAVKNVQVTDNVVKLMAEKITRLEENSIEILKICSCIGSRFDLDTVSLILEKTIEETLYDLAEATREDILDSRDHLYMFQHDRIREAAYSLIPEEKKNSLHLKIGRLMLKQINDNDDKDVLYDRIFYIVNQMNFGIMLISRQNDKDELAGLNLVAGRKARSSAAYSSQLRYLETGIQLAGEGGWTGNYDLTLALYTEAAEAAYLCGYYNKAEALSNVVLEKSGDLLEKVHVYVIKIRLRIAQYQLVEALQTARETLKLLGIRLPRRAGIARGVAELVRTWYTLLGKKIEDLALLPEMEDPYRLAATRVMLCMGPAALFVEPMLGTIIICKAARLAIKYGNNPWAAFIYTTYGMILCGVLGAINSGYRFGRMGLRLARERKDKRAQARVMELFNFFIRHWKEHLRTGLQPLKDAYRYSLETGDQEYASYSLFNYYVNFFQAGIELPEVQKQFDICCKAIGQLNQELALHWAFQVNQLVLNLIEKPRDPVSLTGELYDEEKMFPIHSKRNDNPALFILHFCKLIQCYIYHEFRSAEKNAIEAKKYLFGSISTFAVSSFYFYETLSLLALYPEVSQLEQRSILIKVANRQLKIRKWARFAPMNYLHRRFLLEAEKASVLKKDINAARMYDRAIKKARENSFLHEEGLANELAAKFYLLRKKDRIAASYIKDARECYLRWGAKAKVDDIDKRYPLLVTYFDESPYPYETVSPPLGDTIAKNWEALDLSTVMKASQALSGEIVLSKLLVTLMRLSLESAGAEKGFLILEDRGQLLIEAKGEIDREEVTVLRSIPVDESKELSASIVNYVARTENTLILHDASNKGDFTNDPYILENKPKSILALSIINQGKLTGILYLENSLTTGAFNDERVGILKILSSQVAISIDNARLYENLEEKVQERTEELNAAMQEMGIMNEELKTAQDVAKKDMVMAVNVQTNFLPKTVPESDEWEAAYIFRPMTDVSGDFHDFYVHNSRLAGVGLFDVSGHGIASALITMIAKSIISRSFTDLYDMSLPEVIQNANAGLQNEIGTVDNYLTGIVLRLHKSKVEYVNGSHPDIFIKSKNRVYPARKESGSRINGFFLGVADMSFDFEVLEFAVEKDDIILLYTDGLTETLSEQKEEYGIKRMKEAFLKAPTGSAQETLNFILEDFYNFVENRYYLHDDMTVIVLKKL
ncbi:MAG: AAA family ATPase [bacterium]|nr:AAA family ATPase [bacterium]